MRKRRVVGRIYGMKYSSKGHKDRKLTQEQNKKEWANSVGLCQKHKPRHPHHVKVNPWGLLKVLMRKNLPSENNNNNKKTTTTTTTTNTQRPTRDIH